MPLASVRDALPIRKLCRGRARNLLAQRRRNAVKQLARLPPDPLTLTPHESRPPLGAPQMPTQGRRSMNGRVFSSPVAGFSMTHMSGSKCAMISSRTGSWAQISTRCPGRRPPTLPPRRLGQSTLCRKTAPAVLACLITTSTTKHAQARARLKQFRMLGPIFF